MRPLTTVTHATIYPRAASGDSQSVIMLKHAQADICQPFQASLKVMVSVEDTSHPEARGLHLVYLDRNLFDTKLGGLKRRMAERQLIQNLSSRLESIQHRFEDRSDH